MTKQCLALCGLTLLVLGCQAEVPPKDTAAVSSTATVITDMNFDKDVREAKTPVLVAFCVADDEACKAIVPVVNKLAGEYKDKVAVGTFDVKQNPILPQRFGVEAQPTFIVFKEGEPVDRIRGSATGEQLRKLLDMAIGK